MTRYGMVINLDRCVGCEACAVGCTVQHGLPRDVRWSSVKQLEQGTYPQVAVLDLPLLCMHCAKPPCVAACPQDATHQRDDGIVYVEKDKCIGCGTCATACPYGARHLVSDVASNHANGGQTAFEDQVFPAHQAMTMEKCTFCSDRVDAGEEPICERARVRRLGRSRFRSGESGRECAAFAGRRGNGSVCSLCDKLSYLH